MTRDEVIAEAKAKIGAGECYRLPLSGNSCYQPCAVILDDGTPVSVTRYWWDGKGPYFTINGEYPDVRKMDYACSYWKKYGWQPFYEPDSPACRLMAEIEDERGFGVQPTPFPAIPSRIVTYADKLVDRHRDMTA